jgi:hypothetical protein
MGGSTCECRASVRAGTDSRLAPFTGRPCSEHTQHNNNGNLNLVQGTKSREQTEDGPK